MFICDVYRLVECKNAALSELRKMGIQCKMPKEPKKIKKLKAGVNIPKGRFKAPVETIPVVSMTLTTGQSVDVPFVVRDLCELIRLKPNTEGLFRKEGSKARQAELKLKVDGGDKLDKTTDVIDVAALLKVLLREFPEPVIPFTHHELFLTCALQSTKENRKKALLLACLFLPRDHLQLLTYLLQFFHDISKHSSKNKMTISNLAVVIGPSIFPLQDNLSPNTAQTRVLKINEIVEILIELAYDVGILPDYIVDQVGKVYDPPTKTKWKKRKKRRSVSRMFDGLKKIVGGKSEESNIVTPDLLLTPINNGIVRKKIPHPSGISTKKKKELLTNLPDNVLLSTPFAPRTPVCMDLSGPREDQRKEIEKNCPKEKKWFSRSRSLKNLKQEPEPPKKTTKSVLERRWSAINPSNHIKRAKKRSSLSATSETSTTQEPQEPDYIRVSKIEYETFKNRVSAMERQISLVFENVQSQITTENEETNIQNVQTAYEHTLVQSTQLSPTTDHLARRLSKELKIRRSAEQKIIRSPSARKIGSMRRKSRELEKSSSKLTRHQSWHVAPRESIPRVSLKRGKPNSVSSGLGSSRLEDSNKNVIMTPCSTEQNTNVSCNLSGSSDTWVSAEGFFITPNSDFSNNSGRESLAQLRSKNAGMVLAKAKLFDKLSDSETSSSLIRSIPRAKIGTKIGASRNLDSRLSYRVRNLKYEERRIGKKSMSPKRRNGQLTQKHKIQIAKQYLNGTEKYSDKENLPEKVNGLERNPVLNSRVDSRNFPSPKCSTPRIPPHIKKSLNVRSPKRLCRTPLGLERGTPLRILRAPQNYK